MIVLHTSSNVSVYMCLRHVLSSCRCKVNGITEHSRVQCTQHIMDHDMDMSNNYPMFPWLTYLHPPL